MLNFDEKKGIIRIRMCVSCRGRFLQNELLRLQIKAGQVVEFTGLGRSVYLCENCQKKDDKTLIKAFSKANKGLVELTFKGK